MPNYRRWYQAGGTWFFTVVTCNRYHLFEDSSARTLLGNCIRREQAEHPFAVDAIVLLHDHLHAVWSLPPSDMDFSSRWKRIKANFSRDWIAAGGAESVISNKARTRGQRGIWQNRFWEHMIRDENDLKNHCDYIHYNPVKHEYVGAPRDWPYSSFRRFVALGEYDLNWGRTKPITIKNMDLE